MVQYVFVLKNEDCYLKIKRSCYFTFGKARGIQNHIPSIKIFMNIMHLYKYFWNEKSIAFLLNILYMLNIKPFINN